eukprot:CAMPEP_0184993602 /NCGR_PEP_ID=MMETSP1098-20130426/46125_1 /TAXON_ID=89044 /ORGANISM="Spumella elongata, Strain CCAP 955/1" /LENGTH=73 /DNA_ID=CAMNT_0027519471 /DNA_START=522 /DNA_END=743 /DNA_ORIENTATION=+
MNSPHQLQSLHLYPNKALLTARGRTAALYTDSGPIFIELDLKTFPHDEELSTEKASETEHERVVAPTGADAQT